MSSNKHADAAGAAAPTSDEKAITTLKASLALRGFQVHDTVTGGWLVCRWNLSHYCPHQVDLAAFAKRVGGAA